MEPLTATGFHLDDETEWRRLLSLLARFNACRVTPDYAPHLRGFDQIGQAGGVWISALPAFPADAEIEANLRAAGVGDDELPALLGAARGLFAQVDAQPRGLIHQDLRPDNVGWLGDRSQIVVFDLHKNACGPRFADVAPYLAMPDWSRDAAFLDGSEGGARSRREVLIEHYLDEYARAGGSSRRRYSRRRRPRWLGRTGCPYRRGWHRQEKQSASGRYWIIFADTVRGRDYGLLVDLTFCCSRLAYPRCFNGPAGWPLLIPAVVLGQTSEDLARTDISCAHTRGRNLPRP